MVIRRWAGETSRTTEIFSVTSRHWRIHWRNSGRDGIFSGFFQLLLRRADGAPVVNACLANTTQAGRGAADIDEGPGDFYLTANSAAFSWEVGVEDVR